MAELGRTVMVSGLPTDIEEDRLKDKLCIHFLRVKNGGGEIDSVTIAEASPSSALITFEDSEVAQRVIQHSRHILEVDGKKYELIVTEHHESLDPDKVILSLSATVDYNQLPGGRIALTGLHKSHPDVQINYDTITKLCTLGGAYCKVQAALAELLGQPGGSQSAEHKDSSQPSTSHTDSARTVQKPHTGESDDCSRKPNKQREKANISKPSSDKYTSSSHRNLTTDGYDWDDTGQPVCGALQLPGLTTMSESEDFSLILDADMFQYLQKRCREEYQHILSQYGVEVVDMTTQGVTTLYLQVATGVGEHGQEKELLKLAKMAISKLYHENETKIRKSQLPKTILSPRGGLQRAIEKLSVRLPKLLLNEDDRNVYIIGSSTDVSEAKQFLLLDHGHDERGKKEDVASLLNFPSYGPSSSTPAVEERASSSSAGFLDVRTDPMLQPEEDERRDEGFRRYKLAARFKDSGLSPLGGRSGDFTLRGLSSPSRQTRPGPMLGHDVLSETAGIAGDRVSRAVAQNTGGDILFKSGDALHSSASMQSKTSLNSNLTDTPTRSATLAPLSTTPLSLSGSSTLPPAGYVSTLKRASSFSGMPENKAEGKGQKYQDDSSRSSARVRARSSSFSNQKGRDKRDVYRAEIIVSPIMWHHIKEAYSTRVDDLTSDVQVKESDSQSSSDLTVIIRGADSSKVSLCQQGLQKLVDTVNADFSMQEISLSELGVADPEDETLQACCVEVRSRFKKVTIQILKNSLFLLGPNQLCSQVGASLREVFSGDLAQIHEQEDGASLFTSNWNPSTYLMNDAQSTSLHFLSNPLVMPESQTGKDYGTSRSQERRTNHRGDSYEAELPNGSFSQPSVRKDPVVKEKVKMSGTAELDGQKTETFVNPSTKGNDGSARRVNGVGSTLTRGDKETTLQKKETTIQAEIQDTPEESRLCQQDLGSICVCGEKETTRTECGATMCFRCLDTVHVHCRVCKEKEPTPQGIQGEMSYSKLNISLPGHTKVHAIKITYCIPDGIQGEGHPSPGRPFQGAVFEAYLPDYEKTMKLLPRLKKAFRQGLTFTVIDKETEARVTWDCIPHKTSLQGGRSGNGYPDSSYLKRLSEVLTSFGIGEPPTKSQE